MNIVSPPYPHSQMLDEGSLVDSFRQFNPNAQGAFTYWSVRAGNRAWNRGLRLDYFVCSSALFPHLPKDAADVEAEVSGGGSGVVRVPDALEKPVLWDSFIVESQVPGVSDHCPVGAVVLLPAKA
jgi:exonuclease III